MIRGLWSQQMDARRALSLVIYAAGTVLAVLGFAASPVAFGWGTSVIFLGGSLGAAMGGYRDHRASGVRHGLLWAFAWGGSWLLFMTSAAVIRPTVSQNPTLGNAWAGMLAIGFVLGAIAALLGERKPRPGRSTAILLLAGGLIFGGIIAVGQGGIWVPLGVLSVPVGLAALLVAIVQSILEWEREKAARAA